MGLTKISQFVNLTKPELENELIKVEQDLMDLRFKKATRQTFKSHEIKNLRRKRAQLLTLINKTSA